MTYLITEGSKCSICKKKIEFLDKLILDARDGVVKIAHRKCWKKGLI